VKPWTTLVPSSASGCGCTQLCLLSVTDILLTEELDGRAVVAGEGPGRARAGWPAVLPGQAGQYNPGKHRAGPWQRAHGCANAPPVCWNLSSFAQGHNRPVAAAVSALECRSSAAVDSAVPVQAARTACRSVPRSA
jgi:hypothetical protein